MNIQAISSYVSTPAVVPGDNLQQQFLADFATFEAAMKAYQEHPNFDKFNAFMDALAALDKDANNLKNGNAAEQQMYKLFEKDTSDLAPLFKAYENKDSRGQLRNILDDFTSDNVIWKHILKNFNKFNLVY